MKIRPVGAELFHVGRRTDGRTDRRDGANRRFPQFLRKRLKKPEKNCFETSDGLRQGITINLFLSGWINFAPPTAVQTPVLLLPTELTLKKGRTPSLRFTSLQSICVAAYRLLATNFLATLTEWDVTRWPTWPGFQQKQGDRRMYKKPMKYLTKLHLPSVSISYLLTSVSGPATLP